MDRDVPGAPFLVIFFVFLRFWSVEFQFYCKFTFLYDFNWHFHVFCCHERLNLQLRLKIKSCHWYTCILSTFYATNSIFNKFLIQSPSSAWFTLCDWVPFRFHALFNIRCVLSRDTSSDWLRLLSIVIYGYGGWFDLNSILVVIL